MDSLKPAIRKDLIFNKADLDAGCSVVVKDPSSMRYFKLDPVTARIALLLDGTLTSSQISEEMAERHGATVTTSQIDALVVQLRERGLLGGASSAVRETRQSILAFRVGLFNPDRLLGKLHRWLGFLFSKPFLALSGLLILAACIVFLFAWREWSSALTQEMGLESLLTVYLPALLMMMLHETAHGLACKHFGCSVREMGVVLYYFQPCTFCDVTDSWMLSREKRIYIMLAGIFAELVIWSFAVFLRQLTPEGSVVSKVALGLVLTSGVKCLVNLNPLLKLDGYYILSDLVDLPNLRSRAFALPSRTLHAALPPRDLSRTQRAVLLAYLPLALLYSAAMLILFGWWAYDLLSLRLGTAGQLVFVGLAILMIAGGVLVRKRSPTD